jgi:tetratricopeptide (TPR) repeat protein
MTDSRARTAHASATASALPAGMSEMLARRLRGIHERVAVRTERHVPNAISDIAVHYDMCGNSDKAYQFALLAADRAKASYAHHDAMEFIRIAERNAVTPRQVAEARVQMAQISEVLGKYEEAERLAGMATDFFIQDGDRRRALSLRRMRERVRGLRGQTARRTLGSCMVLAEEARELGEESERAELHMMMSLSYNRLGERSNAEAMAREAVKIAEKQDAPILLGDALNRLANVLEPKAAVPLIERALGLYQRAGDMRGQARCHINVGIARQKLGQWEQSAKDLNSALALARTVGMRDPWGTAALNLGVGHLKRGNHEQARELFGEAFALFSSLGHRERQMYALYNLANLDREQGEYQSGEELYDVCTAMAQDIGQADVEVGSMAGRGLSRLESGNLDGAKASLAMCEETCNGRKDWFQGREMVETLKIRIALAMGDSPKALKHFGESLKMAEGSDEYGAMFLAAECAGELMPHDGDGIRSTAKKHAEKCQKDGYLRLVKKFGDAIKA